MNADQTPSPQWEKVQWIESTWRDIAYCVRSLARAPGFALAVVITLSLGIGVSVAVFHLVAPILFFPSPYRDPGSLYTIGYQYRDDPFRAYRSGLYLQAYKSQTNVFSEFAASTISLANVVVGGTPHVVTVDRVTAGTFRTLGIQPAQGRGFRPQEFDSDNSDVVVISNEFWRQYLDANPRAIGQTVRIDQQLCEVVGVLPPEENLPQPVAVIRPLYYHPNPQEPFTPSLWIIGRLKRGVPVAVAREVADRVKLAGVPQWASAFLAKLRTVLAPVRDFPGRLELWVLAVGTAFLFVIACVNAANLTLVRTVNRSRELSIRAAIGGSRAQLVRLLIMEPLILATAAGAAVVAATVWILPRFFQPLDDTSSAIYFLDKSTGVCIAALTTIAAIALSSASILRPIRINVLESLKSSGNAIGESRRMVRLRNALASAQAALAIVLLGGTGLMVRTFEKVHQINLGFDPEGRAIVSMMFPPGLEPKGNKKLQLFERLSERIASLPGVRAVAYGQDAILPGFAGTAQLLMADGNYMPVDGSYVSANYQSTLGMRMERGHWFSANRHVIEVVINETLAKMRFGETDPIGRPIRLQVSGNHDFPVVGVVQDVRDSVREPPGPRIYFPAWGYPPNISTLVLRLDRDPSPAFGGQVTHTIYDFDPQVITTSVASVHETVDKSLWLERYIYSILRVLTVIALGLSVVGLYSVMAYTAKMRTREFGIRLAIGATAANLRRLVIFRSVWVAGVGIAIGLAVSVGATRFMRSLLFQTTPYDPVVFGAATAVLVLAGVAAGWLPARRAASTDPVSSLRAE